MTEVDIDLKYVPSKLSGSRKLLALSKKTVKPIDLRAEVKGDLLFSNLHYPESIQKYYGEEPEEIDDTEDRFLTFMESVRNGTISTQIPTLAEQNPINRKKLPPGTVGFKIKIDSHLIPILKRIEQMNSRSPVLAIEAATGLGKSIGIPWIIIKHNPKHRVMVTVPTRANVISLYRSMIKYDPSINVGYAADREIVYNQETQIIYATSGHVRNLLLKEIKGGICKEITFADILMIDEIHLGTIDNDIVYSLWERCASSVEIYPRLILSSASIDPEKFGNIPKYTINSESYPVQTIFHDKTFTPNNKEVYLDLAKIIVEYHLQEPLDNNFLVFAPGKEEINKIIRQMKTVDNAIVLPAYSNLERSDLDKIYDPIPGKRKIIVATNIAETGITIENVGVVFDSLLEKRAETSSIGGLRMITSKISKTSSQQRRGRTGRTGPGKYYVMCLEEDYNKLERVRPDEIERVPITETIMAIVSVGLDPITVIKKLTNEKKEKAFAVLQYLKLIEYDRQYFVTEKGDFAINFEMSVYNSATLYEILKNVSIMPLYPAVILTMIDMVDQNYFVFPPPPPGVAVQKHRAEYRSKFEKYLGRTDVHVFGNIWNDLMTTIGGLISLQNNSRGTWNIIGDWARNNSLNFRQIREMIKSLLNTLSVLGRLGFVINTELQFSLLPVDDVIDKIRPYLANSYDSFSLKLVDQKNALLPTYMKIDTRDYYKMDINSTINTIVKDKPRWIIALNHTEILDQNKNVLRFVSVFLDIDKIDYFKTSKKIVRKPRETVVENVEVNIILPVLEEVNIKKLSYPVIF